MSKTILAPFTHARNFISATAFASANGHLPFGQIEDVKKAFNALQAKGFRKYNALYQAIGTHWNVGTVTSGSYKIPDLRNHYIRCTTGAVGLSQKQDSDIQKHSHWMLWDGAGSHTHTYTPYQDGNYAPNVYALYVRHTNDVSGSDSGYYDCLLYTSDAADE